MSLLAELWEYSKTRTKFWLLPILLVLLIAGTLVLAESSAVAPFLYTLF